MGRPSSCTIQTSLCTSGRRPGRTSGGRRRTPRWGPEWSREGWMILKTSNRVSLWNCCRSGPYFKEKCYDSNCTRMATSMTHVWNSASMIGYTAWPRKNATPTITNFKEIRNYVKLVNALMSRTFFFQQSDTKINDFDEGVLILEPFFWGSVIFKICSFCIKSHVWGRRNFFE